MSILDRSLDSCTDFNEISQWRAAKYEIDKKSGDDYTGILTNIYKEPTHFIYELLQNADDAKASNVKFVLSRDKIEFYHDGSKEFSLSDIISITGVGNSSKESHDTDTIGKFGVGFKAVFAVTDRPQIYSTTYNFEIENLSVPSEIPGRDLEGYTTVFQLDFKEQDTASLFRRNKELLRTMSAETILFLKNICSVDIHIDGEQLPTILLSRDLADQSFGRITYIKDDDIIELLKFTRDGCSVVYQMKNNVVVPISGSRISVFFPTIIDSNLAFMVDAPFQTSTTRESIDFELPHNVMIIDKFCGLFTASIEKLIELGLYTVDVFNDIMPIEGLDDMEDFPVYRMLHETFQESITSGPLVPTNHQTLTPATKLVVANNQALANLLEPVRHINLAHRDLSATARIFVIDAGASTFEPTRLLTFISDGKINLSEYSDEWLYKLYEFCLTSVLNDGWSRMFSRMLKHTPLIRTRSGDFKAAFFNESPIVFRPSKGIPEERTIHPMFLTESTAVSDETKSRMKSLLSELGITERKPVIVLKEDYFRTYGDKTADEKTDIFKAAADIYNQSEPKDRNDIETYLKAIAFVPSGTGEFKVAKSLYNSYNTDLKFLLGAGNPGLFCSSFIGDNAGYREFCLKLGLINRILVEETVQNLSNREKFIDLYGSVGSHQDYGSSTKDYTRKDYCSPTLDAIFAGELTPDLTARLAPMLLGITPEQLKETFEWTYYGVKNEVIGPSTLSRLLSETAWIARDDRMVKPIDISFNDFCDQYKLPRDNVLQNLTWSNDNIIKLLSEREQEAIRFMRELDLTPEEMHELRLAALEKRKKTERLSTRIAAEVTETHEHEASESEAPEHGDDTQGVTADDAAADEQAADETLRASEAYEAADISRNLTVAAHMDASSTQSNVEIEEREVLKGLVGWYEGDGFVAEQTIDDKASYVLKKDSKTVQVTLLTRNKSGYNIEISENGIIVKTVAVIKADLDRKRFTISEAQWNLSKRGTVQHSIYLVSRHGGSMQQMIIDDLRDRISSGSARAVPGVIYYD